MSDTPDLLADITHTIQLAVAPVFLLSASADCGRPSEAVLALGSLRFGQHAVIDEPAKKLA